MTDRPYSHSPGNACANPGSSRYVWPLIVFGLIAGWLMPPVVKAGSLALVDAEILFAEAGALQLSAEGQQSLDALTHTLQGFGGILSIRIIGHTDNAGAEEDNLRLSRQRADRLKNYFQRRFPRAHIMSLGAGESIPYASNHNAAGRARNQRVQVQVIATGNAPDRD